MSWHLNNWRPDAGTPARAFTRRLLAVAALGWVVMASTVHAAPAAKEPTLVFEARIGQPSREVEQVLARLREELETNGFAARPDTVARVVGGQLPRPGVGDEGVTASEITQRVNDGYDEFMQGNLESAHAGLAEAIELIRHNPALLAINTRHSSTVFNAHVVLALCQARLGKTAESESTMAELIRMFPDQPISRSKYGPSADRFYQRIYNQAIAAGRGMLAITVSDSRAMIFVDGQIRGIGAVRLGDLIPGVYRVFVQTMDRPGRRYELGVTANNESALKVDWEVDSSLSASKSWVGFHFATEAERVKEASYAGQLIRRWKIGDTMAVIGEMRLQGKPAIIGTLYRSNGKVIQSAVLSVADASESKLRSLARFLTDGTPADDIMILARSVGTETVTTVMRPARKRWLIYSGAAVLALGIGIYALDEDPVTRPDVPVPRTYWDTAPHGIAVGLAGVVTIGVGLWWSSRRTDSSAVPVLTAGSSSVSFGWAGRW